MEVAAAALLVVAAADSLLPLPFLRPRPPNFAAAVAEEAVASSLLLSASTEAAD